MRRKNIKNIVLAITAFIFVGIAYQCKQNEMLSPEVVTLTPSEITGSSAVLSGKITVNGDWNISNRGVCISSSVNPTLIHGYVSSLSSSNEFSVDVTNLEHNKTYYYKAFVQSSAQVFYGEEMTFTTTIGIPAAQTIEVTDITGISAIVKGEILNDGSSALTAVGVCWNNQPNPTIDNFKTVESTKIGKFSSTITSLDYNTTYYVRTYASNSDKTGYGEELSFTTTNGEPLVKLIDCDSISYSAEAITDNGITITERGVCWSKNPNPTINNEYAKNGSGLGNFSGSLNFEIGEAYYVRAYATNERGTGYSEKEIFVQMPNTLTIGEFPGDLRTEHIGFSIGGKGYIGFGTSMEIPYDDMTEIWEFDSQTKNWEQKADFPFNTFDTYGKPRFLFEINNAGYFIIGQYSKSIWKFDPINNLWTEVSNIGNDSDLYDHFASFSINNKGYVGLGEPDNFGTPMKKFWEYDPVQDLWTQLDDFPGDYGMEYIASFEINGKGYFATGVDEYQWNTALWEFDPSTYTWTQKADFPGKERKWAIGLSYNNKGYIGLGYNDNNLYDFWEYDPNSDTWSEVNEFGGDRSIYYNGKGLFAIDNHVYFTLGYNWDNSTQNVYNTITIHEVAD